MAIESAAQLTRRASTRKATTRKAQQVPQITTLLAVLALLLAAGCGTTPPAGPGAQRNLAGSASADDLLAGAMRRQAVVQALPLVQAAAEKSPDRVDIVWLHTQLCTQVAGCESAPLEARLRKLDPGNAAAWIGALARARAQRDTAAESEILDAMGRSERFDLYWNTLVSRLAVAATRSAPDPGLGGRDPITAGLNEAIGWLSGVAVPAFRSITDTCSAARATDPAIAARCLRLSETMLRGDTYIAEAVGLGIRERLATPGTPAATAVAEMIKISRYQHDTATAIMESQLERERFSRELLELMKKLRREQEVYIAVIRWGGEPVLPPTG